jgi:hypothetical protein
MAVQSPAESKFGRTFVAGIMYLVILLLLADKTGSSGPRSFHNMEARWVFAACFLKIHIILREFPVRFCWHENVYYHHLLTVAGDFQLTRKQITEGTHCSVYHQQPRRRGERSFCFGRRMTEKREMTWPGR